MNTWTSRYRCSDCGKEMDRPGTCANCLIENQPVPKKLKEDLKKVKPRKAKVKK